MKIALYSSVAWRHPFGLLKAVEWAKQFGYQAIDCRGSSLDVQDVEIKHLNAHGYDMIGPRTLDRQGLTDLKNLLKKNGLEIFSISCYSPLTVPVGSLADDSINRVRQLIDFAAKLNIKWVKVIGYSEEFQGVKQDRNLTIQLMCDRLKSLCDYSAPKNVGILLENNENCIPNRAEESLSIKEKVGKANLGLVCDIFNAVFEGNDPLNELKILQGNLDAVHLKNVKSNVNLSGNQYAPKESKGYQWTMLDKGDIDYASIIEELDRQKFTGYVVCEYANPYKGMNREFWDSFPDPQTWSSSAIHYLHTLMKKTV
jgi:sugar phosphate isomerase/epimerase